MMAQDNGYYFFKYCMDHEEEKRQNNHIYYVITKDAPDRKKLDAYQSHLDGFYEYPAYDLYDRSGTSGKYRYQKSSVLLCDSVEVS